MITPKQKLMISACWVISFLCTVFSFTVGLSVTEPGKLVIIFVFLVVSFISLMVSTAAVLVSLKKED